jgi:hypothetical protein
MQVKWHKQFRARCAVSDRYCPVRPARSGTVLARGARPCLGGFLLGGVDLQPGSAVDLPAAQALPYNTLALISCPPLC